MNTLDQALQQGMPSRLGDCCSRLTAERSGRRSHPDEDLALERLGSTTDGSRHPDLELDGVGEGEDSSAQLALVHTAHRHLVVSEVQAGADVLEVIIVEHTTEHEDVAGMLAVHDEGSVRSSGSIGSQVRDAIFHPSWHYLCLHESVQELVGLLEPALDDLQASASAPSGHDDVDDALAQAAADVEEVAVLAEAHGLDCCEVLPLEYYCR